MRHKGQILETTSVPHCPATKVLLLERYALVVRDVEKQTPRREDARFVDYRPTRPAQQRYDVICAPHCDSESGSNVYNEEYGVSLRSCLVPLEFDAD
jgi:hypothetical protein